MSQPNEEYDLNITRGTFPCLSINGEPLESQQFYDDLPMMREKSWWWSAYMSRNWDGKDDDEVVITYNTLENIIAEQARRTREKTLKEINEMIKGLMNTEFRSMTMTSGKCEHTQQLTSAYKSALEDLKDLIDEASLTPKDE